MPRPKPVISAVDVAAKIHDVVTSPPDEFVPDPHVCREFNITPMCLYRWTRDPELGFPPVIKIRTQNYRSRAALEVFKARLLALAIRERNKPSKRERVRATS